MTKAYNLIEMLSYRRPHYSVEDDEFVALYLDSVPGMQHDEYGNRFVSVGDSPTVAYMSHTDTVHRTGGRQQVHVGKDGLLRGDGNDCLGADDTTGVWIMLEMIRHGCAGLYIFHRGEECGCLGSSWIVDNTPDLVEGIQAAISLDRRGYDSVVSHQSGIETASTSWARKLGDLLGLGMTPDPGGSYTDSMSYAMLIPECTNLSVGYHAQHTVREKQDLPWATALLRALIANADKIAALPVDRDPDDYVTVSSAWDDGWSKHSYGNYGTGGDTGMVYEMYMAVKENPAIAAQFLLDAGFQPSDFE